MSRSWATPRGASPSLGRKQHAAREAEELRRVRSSFGGREVARNPFR